MPRLIKKSQILFLLVVSAFAIGCETTDYEPLIMKKKMKELETEIEKLRGEVAELKASGVSQVIPAPADPKPAAVVSNATPGDETAVREALENSDAYFDLDDDGFVVTADLLECSDSDQAILQLADFSKLTKLVLDGPKTSSATFEAISNLQGLQHLELERSNPSPEDLDHLKGLKNLKFIQLYTASITEEAMKKLSEFPALEQIRCAKTRVGDAELKHLENLKTLKAIDLSDCNRVTIEGVRSLVKCPKLSFLKVWGPSIDNACMSEVAKMKSLRVLGISDTRVDDEGISKLAGLNLVEVQMTRTRIGDDGIRVISQMKNVESLVLRDTGLTDESVKYVSGLEKLKKLDLSECTSPGITDACGEYLAKMSNLQSLNLWTTAFSDEGLRCLSGLKNLTILNLDNTKITDDGVAMLAELPQLTWLHLGKTKITDREVKVLLGLGNLKYLNISYTGISEDMYYELDDHFSPLGCEVIAP